MSSKYYEILGVSKNATEDDIKKAYRKKAKLLHPDVNKSDSANEEYLELQNAYNYLIESLNRPKRNIKIPHTEIKLDVDLDFIYGKKSKEFSFARNIKCEKCDGDGGKLSICTVCKGDGTMVVEIGMGIVTRYICYNCNGSGDSIIDVCTSCLSIGSIKKNDKVIIEPPRHINTYKYVKDKGNYVRGLGYGDLVIYFNIITPNNIKLDSNFNLYIKKEVNILDYINGVDKFIMKLPSSKKIAFKLSSDKKQYKFNNEGLCLSDNYGRDYISNVIVDIVPYIPNKITDEENKILQKLVKGNFKVEE